MRGAESSVHDAEILDLGRIQTEVGDLVCFQMGGAIEWEPVRAYYLYDVPDDSERGGHAHKRLIELIVAVAGSFEVVLKDGSNWKSVLLNSPRRGLLLPPGLWRELKGFSGGAICLVLAAEEFDEDDYIRDWKEYLQFIE